MTHPIPAAALTQHIAILGKTGSGKSWAARTMVEKWLDADDRVCIIDPTGTWYGLRTLADGKRAGYPIAIFGGSHADFPLQQQHGEELAEIIGTSHTPAILDVSLLRTSERTRLFTDFAEGLLRKNRGPLHLIVDEAHLFAPQGRVNDPQSGAMLHAANNLISLGRSRGLRIVLITQRPAKVHKDSLTQVETLIAMRLIAPQDRKAVEEWIKDNAEGEQGRQVVSSLAALRTGEGWIWAPEAGALERIHFPKIRTFDSGRAPDGKEVEGHTLASIDREAIAARLKSVAQEAEANDPRRLRLRVAELERQLRAAPVRAATAEIEAAERRGFDRGAELARGAAEGAAAAVAARIREAVNQALVDLPRLQHLPSPPGPASPAVGAGRPPPRATVTSGAIDLGMNLPRGEAAVLAACIQYPAGLRRNQLTVLTGYKRSSRDTYIQRLRERGLIDTDGERVTATQAGIAALPGAEPLPTGEVLQAFWLARLPEGERKLLSLLIEAYPDALDRTALDGPSGYKRSSRDTYLQRLAAKELIDEPRRGEVRAAEQLFV